MLEQRELLTNCGPSSVSKLLKSRLIRLLTNNLHVRAAASHGVVECYHEPFFASTTVCKQPALSMISPNGLAQACLPGFSTCIDASNFSLLEQHQCILSRYPPSATMSPPH